MQIPRFAPDDIKCLRKAAVQRSAGSRWFRPVSQSSFVSLSRKLRITHTTLTIRVNNVKRYLGVRPVTKEN